MSDNERDICIGCYTYKSIDMGNKPACTINPIKGGKHCPCSTCLVKMMCEEVCDKLGEFVMLL